jgi:hypothetical protein
MTPYSYREAVDDRLQLKIGSQELTPRDPEFCRRTMNRADVGSSRQESYSRLVSVKG